MSSQVRTKDRWPAEHEAHEASDEAIVVPGPGPARPDRDQTRSRQRKRDVSKLDAAGRLDYLRKAWNAEASRLKRRLFRRTKIRQEPAPARPRLRARLARFVGRPIVGKLVKSAIGVAALVVVGWSPAQRLLLSSSVEAVVNSRLVTMRAPIDGEVSAVEIALTPGALVAPGASLLRITNRRADRTRLDDLRRSVERLEDERPLIAVKLESAQALHASLLAQAKAFQQGRIRQLEARVSEISSEISAARTRRDEAAAVLERTAGLAAGGFQPRATVDRVRREDDIAAQGIAGAEQRLAAVHIELESAQHGLFVGDSYNDRPSSWQRAEELGQQVVELTAMLRQNDIRHARLKSELADETARYNDLAEATLLAPADGSVWELLTAPGEEVKRGQDLLRLLDCKAAVVTAVVSEAVYNRLRIGAPARFRFRGERIDHHGRVVHLSGIGGAPANLAISPFALSKEAYRVTVDVPSLAASQSCHLGRTGRVVFDDDLADDMGAAAGVQ